MEKTRASVERGRPYDIVCMDHMMPDLDGIEAVKQIRALAGEDGASPYAAIPSIALSANAVQGVEEEFLASGMNRFISKPMEDAVLNAALKKYLPEETYTIEEEAGDENGVDDHYKKILEALAGISILNTEQGLRYVAGSFTTYGETLKLFSAGLDKGCGVLRKRLEEDSKSGDPVLCRAETEDFCAALAAFNRALRGRALFAEEAAGSKRGISAADYAAKLADFVEICGEGLPARVQAAAGYSVTDGPVGLAESLVSEAGEAVGLALSMDYDEAEEKLRAIVEKMKAGCKAGY